MSKGVPVGLRNVHYALLTSDDETGCVYSEPVKIADAITVNVNPNASITTLFADDGPAETATSIGEISVEFTSKAISNETRAELLGSTFGADGILREKTTDSPPYVAFGYERTMSNGKKRFVWLTKGKFIPGQVNSQTKEGTVTFQPDTMTGTFVKRAFDDEFRLSASEDDTEFTDGANWFTSVTLDAAPATP